MRSIAATDEVSLATRQ